MPKSCIAVQCFNSAGQLSADNRKISFYKFPLHDKERLQQWLRNMNSEKMVPTKHQHLCSEHFAPSCFEWRWGVRYLKPDAVPTVFQYGGNSSKRKNVSTTQVRKRKATVESGVAWTPPALQAALVRPLSEITDAETLETFAVAIDPRHSPSTIYIGSTPPSARDSGSCAISDPIVGTVNLVPLLQVVEPYRGVSLATTPTADGATPPVQISGQAVAEVVAGERLELAVELPHEAGDSLLASDDCIETASTSSESAAPIEDTECSTSFTPEEAPVVYDLNEINGPGALIIENVSIDPLMETDLSVFATAEMLPTQLVAYFETIATATAVSSGQTVPLTPVTLPPETVLSSAITAPIVSTVPIVSNLAVGSPGPSACASSSESQLEVLEEQLEEPVEPANHFTNEQLVAVAVSLQKKVKALQQRHRRHRAKIKTMEGIVEHLRKENLISEEKLKLLEMACSQSSAEVPESGGTVAILCQEEDRTLVYAMPQQHEEGNETVLSLEEKQHSG